MENLLTGHAGRIGLQFSGGRDSLAMLLLLREHWDKLTVYYCNSGDAFPETAALVRRVAAAVPRFAEVAGRAAQTRERHGWAADVLPAGAAWPWPESIADHIPLIDKFFCCAHSIMAPLHERMKADGITLLLRGQRDSDEPRSHIKNGDVVDGFTIAYPLADWTEQRVEDFIRGQGWDVPPYYAEGATSAPDCMHCTAWVEHGAHRYVARHHPQVWATVRGRLQRIHQAASRRTQMLEHAINEEHL